MSASSDEIFLEEIFLLTRAHEIDPGAPTFSCSRLSIKSNLGYIAFEGAA